MRKTEFGRFMRNFQSPSRFFRTQMVESGIFFHSLTIFSMLLFFLRLLFSTFSCASHYTHTHTHTPIARTHSSIWFCARVCSVSPSRCVYLCLFASTAAAAHVHLLLYSRVHRWDCCCNFPVRKHEKAIHGSLYCDGIVYAWKHRSKGTRIKKAK